MKNYIDPIDKHVGNQLRIRRTQLRMSQVDVAEAVELTFQQIQKYERGINRISASKLWRIAKALGEPVTYFYEGLEMEKGNERTSLMASHHREQDLRCMGDYLALPAEVKEKMRKLIKAMREASVPD